MFTIDDISLARLLVKFKKSLNVIDGEVVVPTKSVKGKNVQLHYEYLQPQEKDAKGWMQMTVSQEDSNR